ncbi:MAG TPA: transglycosylase SLT domain-containing protein [Candidatus Acidoferrales bacterium]|nr:transglycosylase SLT domain-containing protein [Candidatus Acidoferrales bacterium]
MIKKLLGVTFYALPLLAYAANFTEPRAQVVSSQSAQTLPVPVKVTIYKSHRAQFTSLTRLPINPLKLQSDKPTAQEVKAYVQTQALEHGVNPKLALWIVKHESEFNPRARGDGEASRGLWQISRIYHPEVSDAEAFNVATSTQWSLERIRSGKVNEWSTYRFCRTLYEDCPF